MGVNLKNHGADFSGGEALWTLCFGPVYQHQFTVGSSVELLRKAIAPNPIGFQRAREMPLGWHMAMERGAAC